jgi:hypothetical protein
MKVEPSGHVSSCVGREDVWGSKARTEGRDDVARIHGVFVLNEAKAVHELDLGDLAGSMGGEVLLNFSLGR